MRVGRIWNVLFLETLKKKGVIGVASAIP